MGSSSLEIRVNKHFALSDRKTAGGADLTVHGGMMRESSASVSVGSRLAFLDVG
jgi:hypothetical protein